MDSSRLVAVIALATLLKLATAQYTCSRTSMTTADIESCVNAVRTNPSAWSFHCNPPMSQGAPLKYNAKLTKAARRHALDMARNEHYSHTGTDRSTVFSRVAATGFRGSAVGENLAQSYDTAFSVVESWMCSPAHRRNIVTCAYDSQGTAVECNSRTCFIAQAFGCSSGSCCLGGGGSGGSVLGAFFGTTTTSTEPCTGGFLRCLMNGILG